MAQLEEMEAPQEGSSGEPRYFQFVDVIAGPTVKTKADQRRVVRSNAARYQWSQTKSNSKTATKASKKTTKKATNTVSRGYELENVSKELQVTRLTLLDKSASLSTAMLSLPGEDDCNLLKFNFDIILPSLLPPLRNGIENPAAIKWAQLALSSPTLFQIWMRCGAIHRKILRGESLSNSTRLVRCDAQVIRLLNQEMQDPERACRDENILAVGGMAHYGWEHVDENLKKIVAPSQGPLSSLQGLDTYSILRAVPQHLDGLESLIKLRGGLDKIQAEGITGLINYMDVLEAVRDLKTPRYPFIRKAKSLVDSPTARFDATSQISFSAPGCGFPVYWQQSKFQPLQDLYSVIQDMCGYSIMVSEHCQGIRFHDSLANLADRRNHIQHRVMSLPPHPSAPGGADSGDLYEATRLAAIIYSLLVVFPISARTAPFSSLATSLRKELLALDLSNRAHEELTLLCWILVMAGIAAIGTDERAWFIYALNNVSHSLSLVEWDDLKHILKQFLWLDATNDMDGLSLWLEITRLRPLFAQNTPATSFTNSTTPSVQGRGTPAYSPSAELP